MQHKLIVEFDDLDKVYSSAFAERLWAMMSEAKKAKCKSDQKAKCKDFVITLSFGENDRLGESEHRT